MKSPILITIVLLFISSISFSQRDKDEVDPVFKSAFTKYENKEYSAAYLEYSNYLMKKPKDANALYNRGLCAYELKDYKDGITNFSKSIELGRKKADGYYSRGLCNYNLEKTFSMAAANKKSFSVTIFPASCVDNRIITRL